MAIKRKALSIPFPLRGVNRAWARNEQPALTTPDALNVLAIDPNTDRARGGQRSGTSKAQANPFDGGSVDRIMGLHAVAYQDIVTVQPGGGIEEVLYNRFFIAADGTDVDSSEIDTSFYNTAAEEVVGSGMMNEGNVPGGGGSQPYALFTYDHAGQLGGTGPIYLFKDAGETQIYNFARAWVNSDTLYIPESEPSNVYDSSQVRVSCVFRPRVGSSGSFKAGGVELYANMSGPFVDSPPAGTSFPSNFLWLNWYYQAQGGVPALQIIAWTDDGGGFNDATAAATEAIVEGRDYRVELIREGLEVTGNVIDTTNDDVVATVSLTLTSGEAVFLDDVGSDQLSGFALLARTMEFDSITEYTLPPNPGVSNFKVELYQSGGGGDEITEAARLLKMVVQSTRTVYTGTLGGSWTSVFTATTGSKPQMTDINGKVYYVNGTDTMVIDPNAVTGTALVASSGTVPPNCRIAVSWRGRLVLSQEDTNPQNVYMSAAGDPLNWDYNPTPANATQAVALNASSSAGRIGQPVKALIPFKDDVLIIGCDHGIYSLVGDPADGGTVTTISDSLGILQRDAWTISPDGAIYFVGNGGFYVMASPTSVPASLSEDKYTAFFAALERRGNYIQCQWDRDREGCWIFVTKIETGASTHLWWDAKLKAFWPMQFPENHGPLCSLLYDGDGPNDRFIMLGSRDGYIRKLDPAAVSDDGNTISSFVWIGPFRPTGDFNDGKLIDLEAVTGEGTTSLVYQVHAGDDPRAAMAAAYSYQLAWTTVGRQAKTRQRVRGNTFMVMLQNVNPNNRWSIERVSGVFEPSGRIR